jgi:hypothetical protein
VEWSKQLDTGASSLAVVADGRSTRHVVLLWFLDYDRGLSTVVVQKAKECRKLRRMKAQNQCVKCIQYMPEWTLAPRNCVVMPVHWSMRRETLTTSIVCHYRLVGCMLKTTGALRHKLLAIPVNISLAS